MSRTRDFADLINGIAASKITSGSLDSARIPSLSTAKITSGTFGSTIGIASIDSDYVQLRQATADLTQLSADNLTSGTIPSARLSLGASDIPSLATSKITSGTFADGRISSSSVTAHVSAVTNTSGSWTPSPSDGSFSGASGRYHKVGNVCIAFGHAKFSGRTSANDNQFFINGLPFTSRNDGDTQGWGSFTVKGGTTSNVVIANNESRARIYTHAFDVFTTSTSSTEYYSGAVGIENIMITNRNMRQSSNNGTGDNFHIAVCYVTA